MKVLFSDNEQHLNLAPLTLTRPVSDLRCGILTIAESWIKHLQTEKKGFKTEKYLQDKFPEIENPDLIIAGNIKPSTDVVNAVQSLEANQKLIVNDKWVATKGNPSGVVNIRLDNLIVIENLWDLFQVNHKAIEADFKLLTEGRMADPINDTNRTFGDHEIFIEQGAKVNFATLNSSEGPIYIGKNAEIMEGSFIRGPFSLGDNAVVKMAAKIYSGTTIGPFCKVGGEISNSIFQAYSNKGHDGFVGNSLIGEWCNLGADTNTSNLKNNYGKVKLYNYAERKQLSTNVTFCGLVMGDHSKTGINTMLNTATSVGIASNIFGGGFPPKFIPSFSWGGFDPQSRFILEKAFEVGENMMARRNVKLTENDRFILSYLYNLA